MNADTIPKRMHAPRSAAKIDELIAETVLRLRNESGLTQKQVAATVGISYQQLQKYETGKNRMSAGRLYEICRALNVPILSAFEGLK